MHFGLTFSLVLALLAVVGVFVDIPFVSDYVFWVAVAAYVILASSVTIVLHFSFAIPLVLVLLAVVGVFVEIPFVSSYAFWIVIAAYLFVASGLTTVRK